MKNEGLDRVSNSSLNYKDRKALKSIYDLVPLMSYFTTVEFLPRKHDWSLVMKKHQMDPA